MVIIAHIILKISDYKGKNYLDKVKLIPSTGSTLLKVSKLIGAKNIMKQEILSLIADLPIYEIHLRGNYSKIGLITTNDIVNIANQLEKNYSNTIFYTFTTINLKKILNSSNVQHAILSDTPTKINPNEAKRTKKRPSNYYFYILKF